MSEGNWDKHISIFSNTGRLYQIEYTFRAARTSGATSIGLRGRDSVVLVTQKKIPETMIDPDTVTNVFTLSSSGLGCVMTGKPADSRAAVQRARQIAAEFEYNFGYPITPEYLASRMAANNQVWTQEAGKRPLGCIMLIGGIDDEKGPALFKVDPAGFTASFKACCAGVKEVEGTSALEKLIKSADDDEGEAAGGPAAWGEELTTRKAIAALQNILASDFKATDIEVAVVSVERPEFRALDTATIERFLVAIAEED
eukprot:c41192_g1_i1.p2 GENE.c41192_g1_i1~~c41192_g1_i1.p2  ORF type:complete len:274 (+),score=63.37 c41192_g1_i1:55-822(+)